MAHSHRASLLLLPLVLLACSDSTSPTDPGRPEEPAFDAAALATCSDVAQAYQSELAFIQYCARASDCGRPLDRTSCGCTQALVARMDADPARFYSVLDRAGELGCSVPGFVTTCDCPAVDGFACVSNRCTWNYL